MSSELSNLSKNIKLIMSQTTYSEEEALNKMEQFNGDHMKVIRDYLGISEKKEPKIKSINQEIYRQFRLNLDESMRTYREKNPVNIDHVIENFKESDELVMKKKNNKK